MEITDQPSLEKIFPFVGSEEYPQDSILSKSKRSRVSAKSKARAERWLAAGLGVITLLSIAASNAEADSGNGPENMTADQSKVIRFYWQCGGENRGIKYPDNTSVVVQMLSTEDGGIEYRTNKVGVIPGQCGNIFYMSDDSIQTLEQIRFQDAHGRPGEKITAEGETWVYKREFPQCGGQWGPGAKWRENHTVLVDEWVNPTLPPKYAARNIGPQPGQCGNS